MNKSLLFFLVFACACNQNEPVATKNAYFDLNGYFEKQKATLISESPLVDKTVSKGSSSERKRLKIKSWDSELAPFVSSDINKPAWRDSYTVFSQPNFIRYSAKEPKLRTRVIEIRKDDRNQIRSILISNESNNTLYTSTERLEYYPDSLYRITKKQNVILIGTNEYTVTGRIIR
ncbi:MAG: hypothetical protein K0S09_1338 [Sphingobacteriaceae bacterium]|jgi:hypothetical protein|nr:hypothetical protein [Sphingobacteriaceae bacterium]